VGARAIALRLGRGRELRIVEAGFRRVILVATPAEVAFSLDEIAWHSPSVAILKTQVVAGPPDAAVAPVLIKLRGAREIGDHAEAVLVRAAKLGARGATIVFAGIT
jgi:hypothetical protein